VIERRCFVQLIHPGGEHEPDHGTTKLWNRGDHARKFLKAPGRFRTLPYTADEEDEIVFWGEWEPETRVVARYAAPVAGGPRYLYEPFYRRHDSRSWRQNTDPFVFGDQFHYTGCLQHTRNGLTQLRYLAPGSVILFGSCQDRSRFVIDTVLVTARSIDHTAANWERVLNGKVSRVYRDVTLAPWYSNLLPAGQSHRLYFGATPDNPVGGMFSFFPCQPNVPGGSGFARPEITIPGSITPTLNQGKKITSDVNLDEMRRLWRQVADQVTAKNLALGTYAQLPELRSDVILPAEEPVFRQKC
jgi:hypothetical protein